MSLSIDPTKFDSSVKPTDDFFQYVNGTWSKENPIPADEARWGSFDILRFDVQNQVKAILDDLASQENLSAGSPEQKARDFYTTAMDVAKRNALGVLPLKDFFSAIDAIADVKAIAGVVGMLHRSGISAFWHLGVEQDEKKSELIVLHLYQGGLGLPDRDYYLNDDEKSVAIRMGYVQYLKDMVSLAGLSVDPTKVITLETSLARASWTRVEMRDVERQYNKMDIAELQALTPDIAWPAYFAALKGPNESPYFIVGQPEFFKAINRIVTEVPLEDVKAYLKWHVLNAMAPYLTEDIERRGFDFYARTFRGAKEMKPLWRRALLTTDAALDEILGKIYVERHFTEEAKRKIKDLVEHLSKAYEARIERLDWMGPETKQKAIAKLHTVSRKLGYPDVWKDMSSLVVGTDSLVANVMAAQAFEFDRKMKEVNGPVNREEWFMSPQTVNAYYQPPMNEIAFPAAILQPPFFDPNADDAVNFGGIGTVIGHELTHGFDDQGALFDGNGNLNHWWTAEDKEKFDAKAARLAEQFDRYEALPGLHVNGKLTLGENIADLGGLLIAYDGLRLALTEHPQGPIDGLTPQQRFFINYAITERKNAREEYTRLATQIDPHSPGEFRVNGPLSNMKEFYEIFDVKAGDGLWREPEDRVEIW